MVRNFITSVLVIAAISATARADKIFVAWQGPEDGMLGAYDLATGALIGPSPTYLSDKTQGVAVSPLDGNIYMAIDGDAGSIQSYNPETGNVVNANFAAVVSAINGMCFDPDGTLYASWMGPTGGHIAQIESNGTVNSTWGTGPIWAHASNDITIYGDKLYGAVTMETSPCGILAYNLPYIEEGIGVGDGDWVGPTMAYDAPYVGIAFGSDGTMYTAGLSANEEVIELLGPDYDYGNSTLLGTFVGSGVHDIDYCNGYLYLKGNTTADGTGIYRYDLSASTPTWDLFIAAPDGYTEAIGYFDIVSNPVPEPGTIALLGTCLIGLFAYAWRKRK